MILRHCLALHLFLVKGSITGSEGIKCLTNETVISVGRVALLFNIRIQAAFQMDLNYSARFHLLLLRVPLRSKMKSKCHLFYNDAVISVNSNLHCNYFFLNFCCLFVFIPAAKQGKRQSRCLTMKKRKEAKERKSLPFFLFTSLFNENRILHAVENCFSPSWLMLSDT